MPYSLPDPYVWYRQHGTMRFVVYSAKGGVICGVAFIYRTDRPAFFGDNPVLQFGLHLGAEGAMGYTLQLEPTDDQAAIDLKATQAVAEMDAALGKVAAA